MLIELSFENLTLALNMSLWGNQHESLQFGESLHFRPSWASETAIGDCHVYSIYALETVLLN